MGNVDKGKLVHNKICIKAMIDVLKDGLIGKPNPDHFFIWSELSEAEKQKDIDFAEKLFSGNGNVTASDKLVKDYMANLRVKSMWEK